MTADWKPDGYASVSPYLIAEDAQRVIDFLEETFDATTLRRYDEPDGSVLHVEVGIDDSVVMLSDGSDEFPPVPSVVHVYVPDVDATYRRALDAGGESVEEPREREGDPDRRGSVTGPCGTTWAIGTQVEDG